MSRIQASKLIRFKMAVRVVVHNVQEWAVVAARVAHRMAVVQPVAAIAVTVAHAARLMVNVARLALLHVAVAVNPANKQ